MPSRRLKPALLTSEFDPKRHLIIEKHFSKATTVYSIPVLMVYSCNRVRGARDPKARGKMHL